MKYLYNDNFEEKFKDGYTVQPQTKKELADIIKNTCKKKGWNCDLNFIDTSKITDMSLLFSDIPTCFGGYDLEKFNGDISKWNTSNVTNMFSMFDGALFFNHPLNNWDVSNVTNMRLMFSEAKSFNQPLDKWNVSKVRSMSCMFAYAIKFNQPIENWNMSNVSNMWGMFLKAISFNQPLAKWDVSNVTNMSFMFEEAKKFNQSLNNWNTSKVTSMTKMFCKAKSFNQPLDKWDTKNVNNSLGLSDMFKTAKNFDNKIPSLKNFEFKHFEDKFLLLGLSHKYAENHQHDF